MDADRRTLACKVSTANGCCADLTGQMLSAMVMTQGYASRPCRAAHPGLRPLRPSRASILPIGHPAKQPNKTNMPILPIGRPIHYGHPAHWPPCQTTEQNKYTHPAYLPPYPLCPSCPLWPPCQTTEQKQNRPHAARHGADFYHCGADALSAPPPSACSPHTRRPARPACGARRRRAGRCPPAVRRRCRRRSVWRCRRLP